MPASVDKLIKVGFSPRTADAIRDMLDGSAPTAKTRKQMLRRGDLTTRQQETLRGGSLTMAKLLTGGFTRAQAKLILASS